MSLINEALNKSRDDKVTVQGNVPFGAGTSGAQSTEYKGIKGVKKRKTSVLSISILGTILACSIGFYFVSNFTGLIPQFNGGKDVEIQLKDDMDFALHEKVIEAAPVPPESIQDMVKAESQPDIITTTPPSPPSQEGDKGEVKQFEKLVATNKDVVTDFPQFQDHDIVEPVHSSVTNATQPIQEGEKQVHEISPDMAHHVEVQTVESSASILALRAEGEVVSGADSPGRTIPSLEIASETTSPRNDPFREVETQITEGEVEREVQTLLEPASGGKDYDAWYAAYHFGMGVFYQRNREIEKAIEEYNRVIKYDPDNAEVHINFGVIYKEEGDLNKAVEEYKKALTIDPWLDAGYNNLGVVYFLKGNYVEAIKHYQKAIEINPENLESYINLGIAYGMQKRSDKAIMAFQTAISVNPRHAETQYNLAVIYDENGEIEKALVHYSKFLEFYHLTQSGLIDKVKRRIDVLSIKLKLLE